ncbi:MAG: CCA tRNA nucleotidyltransferase [Bdellovibrionales bacterium]
MSDESIKAIFEKSPDYGAAKSLISILEAGGYEAYIVGGAVRDALMGRRINDFDMASSASPEEMKAVFKDYKTLDHGIAFGTLGVVVDGVSYEITTYRGESEYTNRRHPDKIEFIKSKDEDLRRRDFTINAMMFHPERGLYDPFGGLEDIRKKTIQTVGDPYERFKEDALRILRMFRFSVLLGFSIEKESLAASKILLGSLSKLSKERVFTEINKVLSGEIHWDCLEFLTREIFGKELKRVELGKSLLTFEKGYLLSLFKEICPEVGDYISLKELRLKMDFFYGLKGLGRESFRESFLKILDKEKYSGDTVLHFWNLVKSFRSESSDIKIENLKCYPSKELLGAIESLKNTYSGPELGAKILEAKTKSVWG